MHLIVRWRALASIEDSPLFRHITVTRTKAKAEQRPREIRELARSAADQGNIDLAGPALDDVLARLSSHAFRVGLTQDLFGAGYDIGAITQTLRWKSAATASRHGQKPGVWSRAGAQMLGKEGADVRVRGSGQPPQVIRPMCMKRRGPSGVQPGPLSQA